jgi:peptidoglycan hydrolase-like protein with peptidoglycan-binding domain
MLISLFLGLPIVSIAIFGTGLWLGHTWHSPAKPLGTPPSADRVPAAHLPVVAAFQQPARFEPDVEGWQVIKDSQDPEDMADFLAAFPTSRFAAEARTRLRQLQREPAPSSVTSLQVRYAQVSLRVAGFDPGPVDGLFGQQTLVALRQYQASRGLPVTGALGAATQQALQMPSRAVLQAWQQANRPAYTSPETAAPTRDHDQQAQQQRQNAGAWRPNPQAEF